MFADRIDVAPSAAMITSKTTVIRTKPPCWRQCFCRAFGKPAFINELMCNQMGELTNPAFGSNRGGSPANSNSERAPFACVDQSRCCWRHNARQQRSIQNSHRPPPRFGDVVIGATYNNADFHRAHGLPIARCRDCCGGIVSQKICTGVDAVEKVQLLDIRRQWLRWSGRVVR